MLQMNYKYVNTPFNFLQAMATNGALKKRLDYCPSPSAQIVYIGKGIKLPRKTKTLKSINGSKPVASVGDCVSVDLFVPSPPGLIAQMSGFITRHR